jgi:hypothetical protein
MTVLKQVKIIVIGEGFYEGKKFGEEVVQLVF